LIFKTLKFGKFEKLNFERLNFSELKLPTKI